MWPFHLHLVSAPLTFEATAVSTKKYSERNNVDRGMFNSAQIYKATHAKSSHHKMVIRPPNGHTHLAVMRWRSAREVQTSWVRVSAPLSSNNRAISLSKIFTSTDSGQLSISSLWPAGSIKSRTGFVLVYWCFGGNVACVWWQVNLWDPK